VFVCVQYNIFGRTFQAVLEAEDSEVQWDQTRKCFDTSVVYIHRWVYYMTSCNVSTTTDPAAHS